MLTCELREHYDQPMTHTPDEPGNYDTVEDLMGQWISDLQKQIRVLETEVARVRTVTAANAAKIRQLEDDKHRMAERRMRGVR